MNTNIFSPSMTYEEAQLTFFRAVRQSKDPMQIQKIKEEYKKLVSGIIKRDLNNPSTANSMTSYHV